MLLRAARFEVSRRRAALASGFTTWAYKFALLEAGVRLRRRALQEREVLVALTLNGVPLDVLAQRLRTSRGALYKTLHDERRKATGRPGAKRLLAR